MNWFYRMIGVAAPAEARASDAPQIDVTAIDEAAAKTAAKEVKVRCKAILESSEAHGRESLALHLALNTGLSVADVLTALSASPRKSRTPEPTDAASTSESVLAARTRQQADEAFTRAFRRAEYAIPELPAEPVSEVARIQANYALAQGLPVRK